MIIANALKRNAPKHIPVALDFSRGIAMKGDVHLSSRRVMRKIKLGKARPAIFYQFDTLIELSDGSVIKRRSQAPKDEIRMINDQRNSSLWNPNRSDLSNVDPLATGKVNRFKKKFSSFQEKEHDGDDANGSGEGGVNNDNLLELMGQNVEEVQKGGKLFDKKQNRKK